MNRTLQHHGIKGQKWGVRRYQNSDGSLTEAGKERYNTKITKGSVKDANDIYSTLSKDDRAKLDSKYDGKQEKYIDSEFVYDRASINSFVLKHGNVPISLFYMQRMNPNQTQVDIMTRSGEKYRGKGYASKVVSEGMKWIEKNTEISEVYWDVRKDNTASIALAKKNGFEHIGDTNNQWATYRKLYNRSK